MRGLFLTILLFCQISWGQGKDLFDLPKPELVMKKQFSDKNDLTLSAGYFPMNSFAKYALLGASYIHYFNDSHGWEVLNAQMALEQRTSLKRDLLDPSNGYSNIFDGVSRPITENDFATLQYMASTSYVYSPFYMKSLFFNSSQVHMRLSILFGAGMAQFQTLSCLVTSTAIVQKFMFNPGNALSFEARFMSFLTKEDTVRDNISLSLGYVFSWGSQ